MSEFVPTTGLVGFLHKDATSHTLHVPLFKEKQLQLIFRSSLSSDTFPPPWFTIHLLPCFYGSGKIFPSTVLWCTHLTWGFRGQRAVRESLKLTAAHSYEISPALPGNPDLNLPLGGGQVGWLERVKHVMSSLVAVIQPRPTAPVPGLYNPSSNRCFRSHPELDADDIRSPGVWLSCFTLKTLFSFYICWMWQKNSFGGFGHRKRVVAAIKSSLITLYYRENPSFKFKCLSCSSPGNQHHHGTLWSNLDYIRFFSPPNWEKTIKNWGSIYFSRTPPVVNRWVSGIKADV